MRYGASLKFGVASAFVWDSGSRLRSRYPGSTTSPSPNLPVNAPLFVLNVLELRPKWSLPCRRWRNETVAPNERRRSTSSPGTSTTASPSLEGLNTGRVVCFSILKVYEFDTALAPG